MSVRMVEKPILIRAHGEPPKAIEEYFGLANTDSAAISVARMISPGGWSEPGQTPEFDEYTVVLSGELTVETRDATLQIGAGQAISVSAGEWVRYSTPNPHGAEYIAVCVPAYSMETVHRDA